MLISARIPVVIPIFLILLLPTFLLKVFQFQYFLFDEQFTGMIHKAFKNNTQNMSIKIV